MPMSRRYAMIAIRQERKEDFAAIWDVHLLAFGREDHAQRVSTLRRSPYFTSALSLVEVRDGRVVGHILFIRITIVTKKDAVSALSLAPTAVQPEFQRRGIGSHFLRRGLKKCQRLGEEIVLVTGHPEYYHRCGFSSARAKGLEAPFEVSDEACMVFELVP